MKNNYVRLDSMMIWLNVKGHIIFNDRQNLKLYILINNYRQTQTIQ